MTLPHTESASSLSQPALQARVRSARLEDLAQLSEILASSFYSRAGWLGWLYPLMKLGINEDLRQRLKGHNPHYVCLAAFQQSLPAKLAALSYSDCIAGTLELSQRTALPWQPIKSQYLYISNLAVHPEFRRQGIAYLLLRACDRIAADWGFEDLYLHVMEDNLGARHLYHKAGFRLVRPAETVLPWHRHYPQRLLMHRPLADAAETAAGGV